MLSMMAAAVAVLVLRVVSPTFVLLSTISLLFIQPAQQPKPAVASGVLVIREPRRTLLLTLLCLVSLSFFVEGAVFVVFAVWKKTWPAYSGIEINSVLGLLAFGGIAALGAWKDVQGVDVWFLRRLKASTAVALVLDCVRVVLQGAIITKPLAVRALLHLALPACRVLLLIPLLAVLCFPRTTFVEVASDGEITPTDSSSLLAPGENITAAAKLSAVAAEIGKYYGTFKKGAPTTPSTSGPSTRSQTPTPGAPTASQPQNEISPEPTWGEILLRLRHILPYLWPAKSLALQAVAAVCIFLVIVSRFVNILVPLVFAELVHEFENGSTRKLWTTLLFYVGLRFLQGSGGLPALRDALWTPVMQYSDREMAQLSFNHILNLSYAWHLRRKTGEVLRVLDRGSAINSTFEIVMFTIVPTFLDIIIALGLFVVYFEWSLAIVITCVMTTYVIASVALTRWRTKIRRQMNERDIVTRGIYTDCLINYETVKYFAGEQHEGERFGQAVRHYQKAEYKVVVSLNLLNLIQNFIITFGLLVGSLIVAWRVVCGESEPYQFVFFITYIGQLYGPLSILGSIYRTVNQSLVDAEKLLQLLGEPTDVNDKPGAPDLVVADGAIEFDNVNFSYDDRTTALKGVSFKVPKGSSVALVGESGSGKSTILRLLYRFYDLGAGNGRILIDGQDIRDVTQASLRKAIGVVPQDCVLFNASIAYNIGYGQLGATQEQVEAAAKAARMHDRILSFPDGYDTVVGERGTRLSGGEKQRVAIARTLLKNPPILLLDEATSALDTSTEKEIQSALQDLMRGRSSLSIAHRLSTIASADLILVLKNGQVVEQGNHAQLMAMDGVFAKMWTAQAEVSQAESPAAASDIREAANSVPFPTTGA